MRQLSWSMTVCAALLVACSGKERKDASASERAPVAGTLTAAPAADSTKAVQGTGAPKGYIVQLDQPGDSSERPAYTGASSGRWDVQTGPAHILYAAKDSVHRKYSVTATFEQMKAPTHPEAFGVVLGGSALDDAAKQQYTYFLVRGDGKYSVKVRNGKDVQTLTDWTPHPAIPQQGPDGKAVYGIRIDVDGRVAKVRVNGQPVTMFSGVRMPLAGIAGLRINHNLHLTVTPLLVTRSRS